MRGLKIRNKPISSILSRYKTMEVRGRRYNLDNQVIALGNTKTQNVEGYAFVSEVLKIPFSKIMEYESEHRATLEGLKKLGYHKKEFVFGYRLIQVRREDNPFPYRKSPSIFFQI